MRSCGGRDKGGEAGPDKDEEKLRYCDEKEEVALCASGGVLGRRLDVSCWTSTRWRRSWESVANDDKPATSSYGGGASAYSGCEECFVYDSLLIGVGPDKHTCSFS